MNSEDLGRVSGKLTGLSIEDIRKELRKQLKDLPCPADPEERQSLLEELVLSILVGHEGSLSKKDRAPTGEQP